MLVSAVQILTTEKQAGIVMARDAGGFGHGRALMRLIGRIEHQLCAIQLQPRPVAIVAGFRRGMNRESQDVTIKTNCRRHVKNLQQRTDPVNIHDRFLPSRREIYKNSLTITICSMREKEPAFPWG